MSEVVIGQRPVDEDRDYQSVSVPAGSTGTTIISRRVRGGRRIHIAVLANAVQSGGESFVTWALKRNGVPVRGFESFQVQIADPANPQLLPIPVPLDQFDLIELVATNSDGSNAYTATGRIHFYYFDAPAS